MWAVAVAGLAVAGLLIGAYTARPAVGAAAPQSAPVALFLGDSYTAGAGASDDTKAWAAVVASERGWVAENLARGGTGFTGSVAGAAARAACGREECPSFVRMAVQGAAVVPDIVIISGGRNDAALSDAATEQGILQLFDAVAGTYPDSMVFVTNVLWDDEDPPASVAVMSTQIQQHAERVGAVFLDLGQPLAGDEASLAADGVHPNDLGHAKIAEALLAALP
ncbi:SGNH/GDSL hydrolase family protein [Microbacterium sp. zg.Y909]|nr:SGNH/GDSL hydrolase family protein [Microbacterium sp. zg.Y909]